jgi:hypothetical protein
MVLHPDVAYVIDGSGQVRSIMNLDPGEGTADQSSFSVLLADQIEQVLHP